MIRTIDHIAIAVEDLTKNMEIWTELLGLRLVSTEDVSEQGVRTARLDVEEGPSVELISPLGASSPIRKFLGRRGEGLHHICFSVSDIEKAVQTLKEKGVEFVDDRPRAGAEDSRVVFLHPRSLNGILVELKEPSGK